MRHRTGTSAFTVALALAAAAPAHADADDAAPTPSGFTITPRAAPGARVVRLGTLDGQPGSPAITNPSAIAASPDGKLIAVLTSGFNNMALPSGAPDRAHSSERLMIFRPGANGADKLAEAPVPATFAGLAWSADGARIAVTLGVDDAVQVFAWDGAKLTAATPIALGHSAGLGLGVKPAAAGVAWARPDRLLVTNFLNDSVSLVDIAAGKPVAELDLRPGKLDPARVGQPGGTYPFRVVMAGPGRAVVSAPRDRELITIGIDGDRLTVLARATTQGEPTALLPLPDGRVLATGDNADTLIVLAADGAGISEHPLVAIPSLAVGSARPKGLNPNALALALGPGGRLWVTLGGLNAVAAVDLTRTLAAAPGARATIDGLVPTGWYPDAVALAGGRLVVANFKGVPGPNPGGCRDTLDPAPLADGPCRARGQYVLQLQAGSLLTLPPPAPATLARLSAQVAANVGAPTLAHARAAEATMARMRARIKNVIYIVKENRTYDQVLGDLHPGDGDPRLTLFPEALTPNHHALAAQFVTMDRFFDSGEVSSTGWSWSTQARATDMLERIVPVNYGGKGLAYDSEGTNRNVNVSLPPAARHEANPDVPADPDLLAGSANLTGADAPGGEAGAGTLWADAMAHGLSVRNYGFYADLARYDLKGKGTALPRDRDPFAARTQVMWAADARLAPVTDPYFRSFDQTYADYWRVNEWLRDWLPRAASGQAPRLTLLRLAHDHFGSFDTADDRVNTPDRQIADNDYAIGRVAEAVARSPAARSTLIAIVEDDAQNGADHVDAHRSIAYLIGPGVRRGALVHTRYTTVNLLKTIERLLNLPPLGLNDSLALPMVDAFDPALVTPWRYTARWPAPLDKTDLPKPPARVAAARRPAGLAPEHSAAWWAAAMAGQDFSAEDRLDTARFNAALWKGMKGTPRPSS